MRRNKKKSTRARASPAGDAQGHHPVSVESGRGLSHHGRVRQSEEICIGGDFNGHVGATNEGYERVHGGWGYGNRNDDGDQLLQAATTFNLAVANTWFQKRPEHLITYKSGNHATQIDYFLIKRSKLVCVKNCEVLPGEALVTQHRLLLMDITISYKYLRRKNRLSPKIRWRMLETDEYAGRFREIMIENILEMKDMKEKSANDCWDEMANSVRKTAKAVLGESKGKGIIDKDTLSWWWNENVQRELKEKKNAFKKWQLERGNESERQARKNEYRECKKKATKAVAIARSDAQKRLYAALDGPRGQKELYRITRAREERAKDIKHVRCMKNETGKVLMRDDEIKERWKIYFEKLMNEENDWNRVINRKPENVGLVNEISMYEVREAVRSMKSGKSEGPDGIPVEVWKI
ncbi:uncharacterized protein LOC134201634 [Bombyx mori]|uniref:uncharacterized protein LOC134201634 n=1 Tax=Bombyx mori TaxID=7091 RepID=UPI002ED50267